jgi:ATPase subunit of ABC transporter with duplicated ATPase domains
MIHCLHVIWKLLNAKPTAWWNRILLKKRLGSYSEVLNKLSDKQQEFEALDGYSIEYRANEILTGLGLVQKTTQVAKYFLREGGVCVCNVG